MGGWVGVGVVCVVCVMCVCDVCDVCVGGCVVCVVRGWVRAWVRVCGGGAGALLTWPNATCLTGRRPGLVRKTLDEPAPPGGSRRSTRVTTPSSWAVSTTGMPGRREGEVQTGSTNATVAAAAAASLRQRVAGTWPELEHVHHLVPAALGQQAAGRLGPGEVAEATQSEVVRAI